VGGACGPTGTTLVSVISFLGFFAVFGFGLGGNCRRSSPGYVLSIIVSSGVSALHRVEEGKSPFLFSVVRLSPRKGFAALGHPVDEQAGFRRQVAVLREYGINTALRTSLIIGKYFNELA
jgi:hypothetical protein